MRSLVDKLSRLLASKNFFIFIVILLIIQAVWFALTARYPMAFDEDFHFGIIKFHAEQWSPFFSTNPSESGEYGAITRNPSYLYHYLMSFPYRLIRLFTDNSVATILVLRIINVALFAVGLVAYRHLFLKLKISSLLTNISLLILVSIPSVPFLAAHINYDNLLFLLVPVTISLAITCEQTLRKEKRFPPVQFILLVTISLLASIVKYVFLPILLAIVVYMAVIIWRVPDKARLFKQFGQDFINLRLIIRIVLVISVVISGSLFAERYLGNVLTYHGINPSCSEIESVDYCKQYGPWGRDYDYAQRLKAGEIPQPNPNPFLFVVPWMVDLIYRLFFAINYNYSTKPPLPIPYGIALVTASLGIILSTLKGRAMFNRYREFILPGFIILIYIAALFSTNYSDYLEHGVRTAVNGRYLIPVLPIIIAIFGLACHMIIAKTPKTVASYLQISATFIFVIFLTQGGGIMTYLIRSEPDWYWQNDRVVGFNQAVQSMVSPLVFGASP